MARLRRPTRGPSAPRRSPLSLRSPFTSEPLEARTLFAATTNDPSYASQWALTSAGVADAWTVTRGSAAVVVADTDTGADYAHRDLYANVWLNQAEIPAAVRPALRDTDADGIISFYDLNNSLNRPRMTDGNGNGYIDGADLLRPVSQGGWEDGINGRSNANDVYVDDLVGWDFAENDNEPFDDGTRNGGHGTHTAGTMGAVGNNGVGVSGVAQKVSMVIVRIFGDTGIAPDNSRIGQSIRYAADSGARAINASWGSEYGYTGDAIYSAIQYAGTRGALFVTAAGNEGWNIETSRYQSYPAEYALDNIVSVGATNSSGSMPYWSNHGATTVDVMAPGSSILSTLPGNRYGQLSGTSMAAPMVTGAVALMLSNNRALTPAQLKARLIAGSDETSALSNRSVSDGRLDVNDALFNRSGTNLAANSTFGTQSTSSVSSSVLKSIRYKPFAHSAPIAAFGESLA